MKPISLYPLCSLALAIAFAAVPALGRADTYSCSNDLTNTIGSVVRTDDAGNVLDTFGEDVLVYPISVAFDRSGLLYVADFALGRVYRFLPDGTFLDQFAEVNDLVSSIVFHPDGSLLVARYEGETVWRFASDGTPMGEFVSGNGLQRHGQMAFDSSGNLYVCSWTDYAILRYDIDGNPLGVWSDNSISGINGVTGMVFDAFGQMIVSEYATNALKLLDANGFLVLELATTFGEPEYLTLEPDGTLLVPFFYDDTIHRYGSDGSDLGEFAAVQGSYQIEKGPPFFLPESFARIRGRVDAGDVNSLSAVDGDSLRVCRFLVLNATEPPIQVNVQSTSPVLDPSSLTVHVTSRMATAGLFQQEVVMFDENGAQSPTVRRSDTCSNTNSTVSLAADVPPDFVDADGRVQIRINVRQIGPSAALQWCHETDQVIWVAVP